MSQTYYSYRLQNLHGMMLCHIYDTSEVISELNVQYKVETIENATILGNNLSWVRTS